MPQKGSDAIFVLLMSQIWRSLTAATDDTQPSYKQKRSGNNVLYFANLLPDHNFQFSIFNFQLKNFRLGIYALALKRLSSRTGKDGSPSI